MSTTTTGDKVYVARDTAWVDVDGHAELIRKDHTRVREGHPLIARFPNLFEEAGATVQYDVVEQATANPGEKRGDIQVPAQTRKRG